MSSAVMSTMLGRDGGPVRPRAPGGRCHQSDADHDETAAPQLPRIVTSSSSSCPLLASPDRRRRRSRAPPTGRSTAPGVRSVCARRPVAPAAAHTRAEDDSRRRSAHGPRRHAAPRVSPRSWTTRWSGRPSRTTSLFAGDTWTFGRSRSCTETLTLPALSRVAMLVQHLEQGRLRLVARQSGTGACTSPRTTSPRPTRCVSAPHPSCSGPATTRSRSSCRRSCYAPSWPCRQGRDPGTRRQTAHGVRVHGTTAHAWVPLPGDAGWDAWMAVAALAVA